MRESKGMVVEKQIFPKMNGTPKIMLYFVTSDTWRGPIHKLLRSPIHKTIYL